MSTSTTPAFPDRLNQAESDCLGLLCEKLRFALAAAMRLSRSALSGFIPEIQQLVWEAFEEYLRPRSTRDMRRAEIMAAMELFVPIVASQLSGRPQLFLYPLLHLSINGGAAQRREAWTAFYQRVERFLRHTASKDINLQVTAVVLSTGFVLMRDGYAYYRDRDVNTAADLYRIVETIFGVKPNATRTAIRSIYRALKDWSDDGCVLSTALLETIAKNRSKARRELSADAPFIQGMLK